MYFSMFFAHPPLNQFQVTDPHPPPEGRIALLLCELNDFLDKHPSTKGSDWKGTYDEFATIYGGRIEFDDKRSGADNRREIPWLRTVWDFVKTLQHRATPRMSEVCFCEEELDTAHRLGRSLYDGVVAGSVIDDPSLNIVRELLNGEESRQKTSGHKKAMLQHLNERPARMFEILTAGWVAKTIGLTKSLQGSRGPVALDSGAGGRMGTDDQKEFNAEVHNLVSKIVKQSLVLSVLLEKSIEISVILSSLSPDGSRHHCKNEDSSC